MYIFASPLMGELQLQIFIARLVQTTFAARAREPVRACDCEQKTSRIFLKEPERRRELSPTSSVCVCVRVQLPHVSTLDTASRNKNSRHARARVCQTRARTRACVHACVRAWEKASHRGRRSKQARRRQPANLRASETSKPQRKNFHQATTLR